MSIYKRGNTYWCEWEISGQRIRESTGTKNYKEAQEYHDRRRAEIWREAKLGEQRVTTWDEAALAWIDEHAQYKKSYEDDRLRMIWLTARCTGQPLTVINTESILDLRKELLLDKAPSTSNRYMAVISAVLYYAHSKGLLASVPKIPYLPEPKDRYLWITKEQAPPLIAELPEHLAAMTRLALATGLRRANITGLTWDCLDIERRIAWVWPDEAKAGKPISTPLNEDALAVMNERAGIDSRYVFTYRKQPVERTTTKAWKIACCRAGVDPKLTFHDMRHTWASWHVMNGTPLIALMELGGWSDIKMVLKYAHLAPSYVAGYAENSSLQIPPQQKRLGNETPLEAPETGVIDGARTHDNRNHNPIRVIKKAA